MRHVAPAFALALLAPSLVYASPITWSYSSEVVYAQDYGSRFQVNLATPGTESTEAGEIGFAPLFDSNGVSVPEPGSREARYEFQIKVTLTDVASGESGLLTFDGHYSSMWAYQDGAPQNTWVWEFEHSDFGDVNEYVTLDLGQTRYSMRAYGGGPGRFPDGEINVTVADLPDTPGVPEPGTLALGVIGLGSAVLRLRRRS